MPHVAVTKAERRDGTQAFGDAKHSREQKIGSPA